MTCLPDINNRLITFCELNDEFFVKVLMGIKGILCLLKVGTVE